MTDHRDRPIHQTALTRRFFLGISAVAALAPAMIALRAVPARAASKPKVFTGPVDGVGAGGYDVVAYFTQGAAVPGDAAIAAQHDGATWRFASAENRDAFLADPRGYMRGTRMSFRGLRDEADRQAIIAFLRTLETPR